MEAEETEFQDRDMDPRFHAAQKAIATGDVVRLSELLESDPGLTQDQSSRSHPTLLQYLVLRSPTVQRLEEMIEMLAERGAELTQPLIAAASMNNLQAVKKLLDLGAKLEGNGFWSPLEEAIYWNHPEGVALLLEHGAKVDNLRKAAALGDLVKVACFFDASGRLKEQAGEVASPFGGRLSIDEPGLESKVIENALVHAAAWGRTEVVRFLLDRGAHFNAIPLGFDYNGTALHHAALHGHRALVDKLLDWGADPTILDPKVNQTPEQWATFGGFPDLAEHLRSIQQAKAAD